MGDITRKTTGELLDQLITTSLFCWHQQELIMGTELDMDAIGRAAIALQKANARRNKLIKALNVRLDGDDDPILEKTYA